MKHVLEILAIVIFICAVVLGLLIVADWYWSQ